MGEGWHTLLIPDPRKMENRYGWWLNLSRT
jgi:hypothetical protein